MLIWKLRIWGFKTILTLTYGSFPTKVMSLSILTWVFFRHHLSIMSNFRLFYNLSLLSHFLAFLWQFKSKSKIQGHPQKEDNQSFHLRPRFMRFKALLLQIWSDTDTLKSVRIYLIALVIIWTHVHFRDIRLVSWYINNDEIRETCPNIESIHDTRTGHQTVQGLSANRKKVTRRKYEKGNIFETMRHCH